MKKTKYTTNRYTWKFTPLSFLLFIAIYGLFLVLPTILFIYWLFHMPEIINMVKTSFDNGTFPEQIIGNLITFLFCFFIVSAFFFNMLGTFLGKLRNFIARSFSFQRNPYIYFRELPNDFGIGITSLLFDSTLENEKDIVAEILDLCAKGYLKLEQYSDKYLVHVLDKDSSDLLSNELYILNLVKSNNIKSINYRDWYEYCLKDGEKLGLYSINQISTCKNNSNRSSKSNSISIILIFSIIISIILGLFNFIFLYDENISMLYLLLTTATDTFMQGFIIFIILLVLYGIFSFIKLVFENARNTVTVSYVKESNNSLKKTPYGIDELNKLKSFKSFLQDFGNFANKYPGEIILWDRYLSYAQVFGLTRDIMKTGYTQLIRNSAFLIDDIANITLNNIETH